jgi:predicted HTH transcriptional regulator
MKSEKYIQDFVNNLIRQKESNTLDFKLKITSKEKIAKTISALANTKGGYLLIGVSDKRKIVGIDPEEEKYMIESANEEFCNPPAQIRFEEIRMYNEDYLIKGEDEELSLLLVQIFQCQSEKITVKTSSGEIRTYIRKGDQTLAI